MGVQQLNFDDFVLAVREPLCVLDVEPAFQHKHDEVARFMQPPVYGRTVLTPGEN
jgi:hypothetical protein